VLGRFRLGPPEVAPIEESNVLWRLAALDYAPHGISRAARRRAGVPTDPEILTGTCVERATLLTFVLDGERRSQVHAGLARLWAIDRDALMAFYVRGQTLLQMSDEFEAPIGTIKRRLHVARKRLAKEVEDLTAV